MIQVGLSAAEIGIEPGGTAQITITVTNREDNPDHIFLEIEGIDVEWYALPVPSFTVPAGESHSAKIILKVSRTSASLAGAYPFVVRARSMESGDAGFQQAVLTVKPFSALQVELSPKRAMASYLHPNTTVDVNVSNLSNHEETLDLFASEPDDACAFEFSRERISLRPGHSETVNLNIEPVVRPPIGPSRLFGYSVTVRSTEDSYVSSNVHGQLERRPLLSYFGISVLLVAMFLLGVVWALRPHPMLIHSFTGTPRQVVAGSEVTLAWDVSNAEGVTILPDGTKSGQGISSVKVSPTQTTEYTLVARSGTSELRQSVTIVVTPPDKIADPQITSFTAQPLRIHEGETVNLAWKVNNATTVMLNPLGKSLEAAMYTSQTDKPETTTVYELVAKGKGAAVDKKSVTVEVVKATETLAIVKEFAANPAVITLGQKTSLNWVVEGATAVEIDNGVPTPIQSKGKAEVAPQATTIYTLRATDNKGVPITKSITVTVKPAEPKPVTEGDVPQPVGTQPGAGRQ